VITENNDSYQPVNERDCWKAEPRTYELMRSIKSGNVYELSNHSYIDNGLWEIITVQEVQK